MIRTRIAPSPTGFPHLGLIYQAIFDLVLAHANDGKFVLRIEDTDKTRFVAGAEDVIYNSLSWVGLLPDEGPREGGKFGPYRQSERLDLYKEYANQLIENNHAYRCFCTKERLEEMRALQEKNHQPPRYDKTCRILSQEAVKQKLEQNNSFSIRMKIPEETKITVKDVIVGEVVFDSNQLDDQVILKSDGFPTYHLAVVVDDKLMEITHVFRGTEWLPSYPKHVLLWQYLGWEKEMPLFIHVPILLNSQGGGKLSKRHATTSIVYYQQEGFLPEAVVNYLANIVWNHPEGKEIFPLMDFAKALQLNPIHFDIKPNGVHFDLQKLIWMNAEYIRMMDTKKLKETLINFFTSTKNSLMIGYLQGDEARIERTVELAKTRMKTLKEFESLVISVPIQLTDEENAIRKKFQALLEGIDDWNKDTILAVMRQMIQEYKIKGNVLYKLMTGRDKGLPLPEMLEILGKEKTLGRLGEI